MRQLRFNDPGFQKKVSKVFIRDAAPDKALKSKVADIIESIITGKDKAISRFTKTFDGVDILPSEFRVDEAELSKVAKEVSSKTKEVGSRK